MLTEWNMKATKQQSDQRNDLHWLGETLLPARRRRVPWLRGVLVLLALSTSHAAWATGCSNRTGYPKTFTVALPGSSMMVPRDLAVGSTIAVVNGPMLTLGSPTDTSTWFAQCTTPNGTINGVMTSTPWPLASPGTYSTNVAGIGVRITRGALAIPGSTTYTPASFPGNTGTPYGWYWYAGPAIVYTFVKTGPISGGTVSAADIPTFSENFDGTTTFIYSATSGQATFTAGACSTPDVLVTLQPAAVSAFTAVGKTANATPFTIDVNGCPPGLNAVQYQLDAAAGVSVVNASTGVIGLDSSSTATGIALQIKDASNNPVPLSSKHATTGYNSSLGGNFSIPLNAMYYQTASRVTAGKVSSQAVLTMSYL
jgi:major type 1 subunit fimbrin (pilin)